MKEAFREEVKAQILRCGELDEMIREANPGKVLQDFTMMDIAPVCKAYVRSIEGAMESGRRAARAIDSRMAVIDQYIPGRVK